MIEIFLRGIKIEYRDDGSGVIYGDNAAIQIPDMYLLIHQLDCAWKLKQLKLDGPPFAKLERGDLWPMQ